MCLTTFGVHSNPHLKTLQLAVFEVITFHETKELVPFGDSYDLYPGNNDPTEGITLVIFGIPFRN